MIEFLPPLIFPMGNLSQNYIDKKIQKKIGEKIFNRNMLIKRYENKKKNSKTRSKKIKMNFN